MATSLPPPLNLGEKWEAEPSLSTDLRHLYPFMNVETAEPQERITSLDEDGAFGTTAPGPNVPMQEIQEEISNKEC